MRAFPSAVNNYPNHGMDLRDYFAAKAMEGLLAANPTHDMDDSLVADALANASYFIADAMMEARKK